MTYTELKQYIFENNKTPLILEEIGCNYIEYHNKGYYTCSNPDGDNKKAIIVYNDEYLKCINYTRKISDNGYSDLITLVSYNKKLSFAETMKYLHKLLNLEYKFKLKDKQEKIDPLEIFKKVKSKRRIHNVNDIEIFDEDIIKEYIPLPHIDWIREGILPFTCEIFGVGYSADKKRITLPWRYWSGNKHDIVGVVGRTTISHYDILDIPKYFPLKVFLKGLNLYGLQENYNNIQTCGYCVVAESEKSVLKRHSRKDGTIVAIGCHDISDEQVKILVGLNVDIVIGFDKGISLQHIRFTCEKFYGIREVSYIWDKYDVMKDKQAPMDLPDKTYKYMLKHRIAYDENEHKEYLKERDKNEKRL